MREQFEVNMIIIRGTRNAKQWSLQRRAAAQTATLAWEPHRQPGLHPRSVCEHQQFQLPLAGCKAAPAHHGPPAVVMHTPAITVEQTERSLESPAQAWQRTTVA